MALTISEVSVCNSALVKLGADRITSLSQDTKNAKLCNDSFYRLRDEVLRQHTWNFATKRAQLASLATTPEFEWDYEYQLPADFIRLVRGEDWSVDYAIEGQKILCNETPIKIVYIFEETEMNNWDYIAAEALAWRIAAELAYAITQSNTVAKTMLDGYANAIREARFVDAAENAPKGMIVDSWTGARL